MAQDTYQGDHAMGPSPKCLASPEAAETGMIHVLELPETPALAAAKLRVAGGDWFHRAQRESIGVLEVETKQSGATTARQAPASLA
jgi:hypothetical protein